LTGSKTVENGFADRAETIQQASQTFRSDHTTLIRGRQRLEKPIQSKGRRQIVTGNKGGA
jgi:hypothetical protein